MVLGGVPFPPSWVLQPMQELELTEETCLTIQLFALGVHRSLALLMQTHLNSTHAFAPYRPPLL